MVDIVINVELFYSVVRLIIILIISINDIYLGRGAPSWFLECSLLAPLR